MQYKNHQNYFLYKHKIKNVFKISFYYKNGKIVYKIKINILSFLIFYIVDHLHFINV